MAGLLDRITVNPERCGSRPCVRGMRIRVSDVLDLFAAGLDATQILDCGNASEVALQQILSRHLSTALALLDGGEDLVEIGSPW